MEIRRLLASLLVICIAGLGLPLPSQAAMLGTDAALGATQKAAQRDHVASLLDRADVQAGLKAHGVSAADVKARVAALSDDEVAQLAGQIERVPAGGDVSIIGAIVLVFIVLLITDILGFTKIFPFTRPIR